ncbi:MAG: methyl-accepting chemotaxis protein [Spirochaetes bacterium]|nr:methyl-accepting chemotaxis protein [Spirochaetota bacterium]
MFQSKKRKLNIKRKNLAIIIPSILLSFSIIFFYIIISIYNNLQNNQILNTDKSFYLLTKYIDSKYYHQEYELLNIFKEDKNITIPNGILFILDKNNEIIFDNNTDQIIDLKDLFKDNNIQEIINDKPNKLLIENKKTITKLFYYKINNKNYKVFFQNIINIYFIENNLKMIFFSTDDHIKKQLLTITWPIILIFIVSIIFIIAVSNTVGAQISDNLNKLNYAVNKISSGKLDLEISSESIDEIGMIYKNLNNLINSYISKLSNLKRSSIDVLSYQNKIDLTVHDIETKIKNQLLNIKNNMKKIEDLNNSIMKISFNVTEAQGIIDQAHKYSNNSTSVINNMIDEINKIAFISEEINNAIELIDDISEKTRLLSVNSAIEASRAGEAGKGFNVVAMEIKKLALQSKEAANKIGDLVKTNSKIIKSGVEKIAEVFEVLNNIESSIKMISDIMNQINLETSEKSNEYNNIKVINNNILNMSNDSLKNLALLNKLKIVFNSEINKIINVINNFIIISNEKEIIRDFDEKGKILKKIPDKFKSINDNENIDKKNNKINLIKSIKLYQPDKSISKYIKKKK